MKEKATETEDKKNELNNIEDKFKMYIELIEGELPWEVVCHSQITDWKLDLGKMLEKMPLPSEIIKVLYFLEIDIERFKKELNGIILDNIDAFCRKLYSFLKYNKIKSVENRYSKDIYNELYETERNILCEIEKFLKEGEIENKDCYELLMYGVEKHIRNFIDKIKKQIDKVFPILKGQ